MKFWHRVLACAAISVTVNATAIHVPSDQPTIQSGNDAAVNGDTVLVAAGTYVENIDLGGKNIVLRSESGRDSTSIVPGNPDNTLLTVPAAADLGCMIDGFTIGGTTDAPGISVGASVITVQNSIVGYCPDDERGAD